MELNYWTTGDGRRILYKDLEDDHLKAILRDGYRNSYLKEEAIKRNFLIPLRPDDSLTETDLALYLESFASCAIEGNVLAEKFLRLYDSDKALFFLNLNRFIEQNP